MNGVIVVMMSVVVGMMSDDRRLALTMSLLSEQE
jgi:hypothetical protein